MNELDGGAAFPTIVNDPQYGQWTAWGMSLRDYFAASALVTVAMLLKREPEEKITDPAALIAEYAYRLADALLAQRSK